MVLSKNQLAFDTPSATKKTPMQIRRMVSASRGRSTAMSIVHSGGPCPPVQCLRRPLQRADDDRRLLGGTREVAGVDGFADAGNRLHTVSGVQTGRVDDVLEPRTIRKPGRLDQVAFRHDQP